MDKKRTKDWQYSVGKIGANLQTVVHLVCVQWSFLGRGIYSNNINAMNKGQRLWLKDTRVPMCARVCVPAHVCACVCAWVRVRARVGTCVCACAWVMGFVSRFVSRGCVRVGACVCACARVGGVGCKAARTLARGPARWICTIHHEHKGISCYLKG